MKKHWEIEELVETWTLLPSEIDWLTSKPKVNRLGIAILLKFFQFAIRFPSSPQEVCSQVVEYIAQQINVPPEQYLNYDWDGRTYMRHRSEVREFLGFRKATVADAKSLRNWLVENVLNQEAALERLHEIACQRFHALKIESPSAGRVERLVRSAVRQYETDFFQSILEQLSPECQAQINTLLDTSNETTPAHQDESTAQTSLFRTLNTEPGRTSLNSLFEEIFKLQRLRSVGLPPTLFEGVAPKVLQTYAARAATEPPRELRAHPKPIRCTLVAAFCWLRMGEVTDNLVDLLMQMIHQIGTRAERKVDAQLMQDFKRVSGKDNILYRIATASLEQPEGRIKEVIYPAVGEQTLKNLVKEFKSSGTSYRQKVHTVIRSSYSRHYRRVLQALRERLRCKEIWVVGANRYRNPEADLPSDFDQQRELYYQALKLPTSVEVFIAPLRQAMEESLQILNDGLSKNPKVKILGRGQGGIRLSPLDRQPEPSNIIRLKTELVRRWPITSLLDILKETDLQVNFTDCFKSLASRETLDRETIQKRLLLCLYGLGTNTGLKRVSDGTPGVNERDLRYVKRRFLHKEALRKAIAAVVNAVFQVRHSHIWGEGTTTCASDSKKFGAYDQNLMTEWHIRDSRAGSDFETIYPR